MALEVPVERKVVGRKKMAREMRLARMKKMVFHKKSAGDQAMVVRKGRKLALVVQRVGRNRNDDLEQQEAACQQQGMVDMKLIVVLKRQI